MKYPKKSEEAKKRWKDPNFRKKNKTCLGKHWKLSDEQKKKHNSFKKGFIPPNSENNIKLAWEKNRGRKQTFEEKEKRSKIMIAHFDKKGRKNKKDIYSRWSFKYKIWRKSVFERDSYACQVCRKVGCYLVGHHIKSWVYYPELRFDVNNGITLCEDCHKLTTNFKGKNNGK